MQTKNSSNPFRIPADFILLSPSSDELEARFPHVLELSGYPILESHVSRQIISIVTKDADSCSGMTTVGTHGVTPSFAASRRQNQSVTSKCHGLVR